MEGNKDQMIRFFQKNSLAVDVKELSDVSLKITMRLIARPNSKKEKISADDKGNLLIAIKDRAVENQANSAILKAISKKLGVSKSSINLVRGGKSKNKQIQIIYIFTKNKDIDYYLNRAKQLFE